MIDDEDSKVRRNLMVMSTAILVVTFTGVQPVQLLQDMLKSSGLAIPPWKTWTVAAVTLAYLWHRFHVSKNPTPDRQDAAGQPIHSQRPAWRQLWEANEKVVIERMIEAEGARLVSQNQTGPCAVFRGKNPISELLIDGEHTSKKVISTKHEFEIAITQLEVTGSMPLRGSCYFGLRRFTVLYPDQDGILHERGQRNVQMDYRLPLWQDIRAKTAIAHRAALTTAEGLENNLPRLMCWLAWFCITWQFWKLVIQWWMSGSV